MTVYVHKSLDSVGYASHGHYRDRDGEAADERTWRFSCTPVCEERICSDVEFADRTPAGVPLTVDERAEAEIFDRAAQKDVAKMAMALTSLAKDGAVGAPA